MSIIRSNGHVLKRRKLSHASSDEINAKNVKDSHSSSDDQAVNEEDSKPVQAQRNPESRRKNTSTILTGGMTKSSLLQLQVDELLDEVRPDFESHLQSVKSISEKLIQIIKAIPERLPVSFPDAEQLLRREAQIAIPFLEHRPDKDIKYNFEYKRPEKVSIRGGLVQHLTTNHHLALEVAVQMPSELFQEKDYLNHRGLHKRAYYTACIAAGLKNTLGEEYEYRYEAQYDNGLVPQIRILPSKTSSTSVPKSIRILVNVLFPLNFGPIEKILPSRSCVRSGISKDTEQTSPTPYYNSTIRSLATAGSVDQLLVKAAQRCDSFSDACLLGQIWLHQRGLSSHSSAGGFGWLEWAHMCALLLVGGGHKGHALFSDRYSSVQLFKAMLQVMANRDLTDPLLVRCQNVQLDKSDLPILFDGANGVNILFKMTRWSYDYLRQQAQLSLTAVNGKSHDQFDAVFISKVAEPALQYDNIYLLDTEGAAECTTTKLYDVLRKGLGDRISALDLRYIPSAARSINASLPKQAKNRNKVWLQLLVNPDAASRLIDHGPSAEQQDEAREFRKFWGDKSELRRFRDGSITETLVWSPGTAVILQIIQYLLAYHFQITQSSVHHKSPELQVDRLSSKAPVTAEDAFKVVNSKYQELSSRLHQMEGLPLPIRSVSPSGNALRSASMCHPLDPTTSAPIDMIIQFDSSARWPEHLQAIQHTKVAFLAKISDLITEADSSLRCRVGVENTGASNTVLENTSFLDIISPSPAPGLTSIVFRLRIYHERELQLIQDRLSNQASAPSTRDMVSAALIKHKRVFMAPPIHTSAIRNLITHFQPLSSTIRLLKSWFASHNLSSHVPDPVIEILAAQVFLQPYPWTTPGSASTAFLRCLHHLAHWDWVSSPLIVDLSLSQDMTSAQLTELDSRFQAWRKLDPNMNTVTWFVGTNIDITGTIWTQGALPQRVIAGRVTALAKAAIDLLKSKGSSMAAEDWKSLFVSPTSDFDFVINLKSSVLRGGGKGKRRSGAVQFKNLEVQEALDIDSIGHDTVSLFREDLETAFSNIAVFFYGDGGRHIAGLWKPGVLASKDWRVRMGYSTVPSAAAKEGTDEQAKDIAQINRDGILAEMALLGEGIIETIDVKK